jgi:mannose-1-phosphate guanylyltransferase
MGEPSGKNTAPAVAWACRYFLSLGRPTPSNILMMASDHVIKPTDSFVRDVRAAAFWADKGNLVSFSIPPVTPATGYGYIKAGPALIPEYTDASPAWRVDSFKEKPDEKTAQAYVNDGHYFWNSGIYAFRADFYLEQLALLCPAVSDAFIPVSGNYSIEEQGCVRVVTSYPGVTEAYGKTPSISIDYAVSEKCAASVTIQASFLWDDVGTWDSLEKYFDSLPENTAPVESRNCFVYSDIPIALCGVDDLVVVIRNGRALVAKKGDTNLVKDALSILKEKGLS